MKEDFKNFIKIIICLIVYFNIGKVISYLLSFTSINIDSYNIIAYLETIVNSLLTIMLICLYEKYLNKDLYDIKNKKHKFINDCFKYICLLFVIKIAASYVTTILNMVFETNALESENQIAVIDLLKTSPILMIVVSCILAPIVEEGIFRLGLRKVMPTDKLFIVLSGFIFGFMHIFPTDLLFSTALVQSITYVAMGIYLAYIYVKTDNIWLCITVHAFNNLLSSLLIMMVI